MTTTNTQPKHTLPLYECVLCKDEYMGYGNNADPVAEGKCCDNCNFTKVIGARLDIVVKEEEEVVEEEPATTDIDLNTATEENADLWVSFRVRAFKRLPVWTDQAEDEVTRMLYASHKMELICKFHDCDSVGHKPTGNRSHIYYIIKNNRPVMCYVLDLRLQTLSPNIPQFQDATRHLN